MNQLVKFLLVTGLIGGVLTAVSFLVPSTFSSSINNAFVYFLEALANMNFLLPIAAIYDVIQILGNFIFGMLLLIFGFWITEAISN
jgi:hypothetical protein